MEINKAIERNGNRGKGLREYSRHLGAVLVSLVMLTGLAFATDAEPSPAAKVKLPEEIKSVVPLGSTAGIRLQADGVVVVGITNVVVGGENVSPSRDAGLAQGDVIISINGTKITESIALQEQVEKAGGKPMTVRVLRDSTPLTISVTPVKSDADGGYRIGVWVRDNMMGIGTLTFYEPKSGLFGALGHGISDMESQKLLPMSNGQLMPSNVTGVRAGQAGVPGELQGSFENDKNSGRILQNTGTGIYGVLKDKGLIKGKKAIPVADVSEIVEGPAEILSNVDGCEIGCYSIKISRIYPEDGKSNRNMLIEVTDAKLIARTGGIVQGMSGSPIIQNGKLIGAVTHVLVNDPVKGYGIFVQNMIKQMYTLDGSEVFAPLLAA